MTEREDQNHRFIISQERKLQLQQWLSGFGELTPEETELVSRFGGPHAESMARQALAIHRKTMALDTLNSPTALTPEEKTAFDQLGGPNKKACGQQLLRTIRQVRIKSFLNGDPEEDLGT